jgi:hypothetical protein
MRTIIIMFVLGLALGFQGCTQKEETIEDDQEIIVNDNAENVQKDNAKEEDEKHLDNPAEIMEDLIF